MKLSPVAVFGKLAKVGLQLIKILHGGYRLFGGAYVVRSSFLDTYSLSSAVLSVLSIHFVWSLYLCTNNALFMFYYQD